MIHLTGQLRVIVAFESPEIAYVVLIGNHNRDRPPLDIYQQLYKLAGHQPSDEAGRDKPPCCDTETSEPPADTALLDELLTSMRRFRTPDLRTTPSRRRST